MRKIKAIIDGKTGKLTLSTEGYQGADCLKATAELEGKLGLNTENRELTPDYYAPETQEQHEENKS